jgi:hypothetical protein
MAIFILYGALSDDLSAAKKSIESALGFEFEARDSSYHGCYFLCGNQSGAHMVLKRNLDQIDGGPVEIVTGDDYGVLLYVNEAEKISGFRSELVEKIGFHQLRFENI